MISENFVLPNQRIPLLSKGFSKPELSLSVEEDKYVEVMKLFSDASTENFNGNDEVDTMSRVTFAMHDFDPAGIVIRFGPLIDTDKNLSIFCDVAFPPSVIDIARLRGALLSTPK